VFCPLGKKRAIRQRFDSKNIKVVARNDVLPTPVLALATTGLEAVFGGQSNRKDVIAVAKFLVIQVGCREAEVVVCSTPNLDQFVRLLNAGKEARSTALIQVKIVALAPMPSQREHDRHGEAGSAPKVPDTVSQVC